MWVSPGQLVNCSPSGMKQTWATPAGKNDLSTIFITLFTHSVFLRTSPFIFQHCSCSATVYGECVIGNLCESASVDRCGGVFVSAVHASLCLLVCLKQHCGFTALAGSHPAVWPDYFGTIFPPLA